MNRNVQEREKIIRRGARATKKYNHVLIGASSIELLLCLCVSKACLSASPRFA